MSNVNDSNIDKMSEDIVPDVVLVKKVFADKSTRNARRRWKLKHLTLDDDAGSQNRWVCECVFKCVTSAYIWFELPTHYVSIFPSSLLTFFSFPQRDYTDFLEDLEEDPQYRTNVNIYRDESKAATLAGAADEAEDLPQVSLEEMLEDLVIDGGAAAKDVEEMME